MDRVIFLTIEFGTDLILSFSFNEGTKYGIEGYSIHRTPKFEFIFEPEERGPCVDITTNDRRMILRSVSFDRNSITLKADNGNEQFDISRIDDSEFTDMIKVLKKMNFDKAFTVTDKRE